MPLIRFRRRLRLVGILTASVRISRFLGFHPGHRVFSFRSWRRFVLFNHRGTHPPTGRPAAFTASLTRRAPRGATGRSGREAATCVACSLLSFFARRGAKARSTAGPGKSKGALGKCTLRAPCEPYRARGISTPRRRGAFPDRDIFGNFRLARRQCPASLAVLA